MKLIFFALCMSLFTLSIFGQAKKAIVKPTPVPNSVTQEQPASQKVIVEKLNGDRISGLFVSGNTNSITIDISSSPLKINLSEIRRLQFTEDVAVVSASTPVTETVKRETLLEVEGAIIFKNGDTVPLARANIGLLDESAATSMTRAGIRDKDGKTDDQSVFFAFLIAGIQGKSEAVNTVTLMKQHLKYEFQTDFNGRARITDIAPGKYYLFTYSQIRKANVIWNLPIEIKEGEQLRIVLDQSNAALAL